MRNIGSRRVRVFLFKVQVNLILYFKEENVGGSVEYCPGNFGEGNSLNYDWI